MPKLRIKLLKHVSLTPPKSLTLKDIELSRDEINNIMTSPLLLHLNAQQLPDRIQRVSRFVKISNGLLSKEMVPNAPSPFEIYKQSPVQSSRVHVSEFPRLSVTRLLTDSWCELRELYTICSQQQVMQTVRMAEGNEIHEELELLTHHLLKVTDPTVLSREDVEGLRIIQEILKLVDLLTEGEAREVYYNLFMNSDGFVVDPTDEDILLTGIVDHLKLSGATVQPGTVNQVISRAKQLDFSQCTLEVYDVKTRATQTIPRYKSVIQAAKDQVRMYERMITLVGESPGVALRVMEEYCARKGVDIDKELSDAVTALTKGTALEEELPKWTIRHLLGLLSELAHLVSRPAHRRMGVAYHHGLEKFKTVHIDPDEARADGIVSSAMLFWQGRRDTKPMQRSSENASKCRFCEYQRFCAWAA